MILLLTCLEGRTQTDDTICFKIPVYKEILKLAEKGASCDSIVNPLLLQIEKDHERVTRQSKELAKSDKKRRFWTNFSIVSSCVAVLEGVVIVILAALP